MAAFVGALCAVALIAAPLAPGPHPVQATPAPLRNLVLPTLALEWMRRAQPDGTGNTGTKRLDGALLPDGRLRPGAAGSFSVDGYAMTLGSGGTPHFVATPGAGASSAAPASDDPFSGAFQNNRLNNVVSVITVAESGDVYIGGAFTNLGGDDNADYVARWDGLRWNPVGGGTGGMVYAIAVSGDDVYVGGQFTTVYSSDRSAVIGTWSIARWNTSSGRWSALGQGARGGSYYRPGGNPSLGPMVEAIAVHRSDVYVGGGFDATFSANSERVSGTRGLARWNSVTNTWSPVGGVTDGSPFEVRALALGSSHLYVGGVFPSVRQSDGTSVASTRGLARWHLSAGTWSSVGGGAEGNVFAIAASGSDVYVGGDFSRVYRSDATAIAGTRSIARWDESTERWEPLGGGSGVHVSGESGVVHTIAVSGSDVYVGGSLPTLYESDGTAVANTRNAARWSMDTRSWSPLGNGTFSKVQAMAASGTDVLVGGDLVQVINSGNVYVASTPYLARWNGSAWGEWPFAGRGANWNVNAIVVTESGDLYVGGGFTDLGGAPGATGVARWDGTAWRALGYGIRGGVLAIAVRGDQVYVAGYFSSVNDPSGEYVRGTNNIAVWDVKTSRWSPMGSGANSAVMTVALQGTDVYVGGSFSSVSTSDGVALGATRGIARWSTERQSWSGVGGGSANIYTGQVNVIAIAVSGPDVYVGGIFDHVYGNDGNAVPMTKGIARWSTETNSWSGLGGGITRPDAYNQHSGGAVRAIAASGSDVYVGGDFTRAHYSDGTFVDGIRGVARWNTQSNTWSPLGGSTNGYMYVYAMTLRGRDLYVGGSFSTVYNPGGVSIEGASNVARWNEVSSTWSPLGRGVNSTVHAFAFGPALDGARSGTVLYLGGAFTSASGIPASRLTYYTEGVSVAFDAAASVGTLALEVRGNGSRAPRVVLAGVPPGARADVSVFDVLGRRVRGGSGVSDGDVPMDLSSLAGGVYVVRVVAGARVATASVVVR